MLLALYLSGFSMIGYSDTSTRTFFAPGVPVTTLSTCAVTVSGFSTVFGTDAMSFFYNTGVVGFTDDTLFNDVLDFQIGTSYDIISAIGPLSVHAFYSNQTPTTQGDLIISSATSLTFQAVGGVPVPEPGTLALLATGLLGLGWFVRRRSQRI